MALRLTRAMATPMPQVVKYSLAEAADWMAALLDIAKDDADAIEEQQRRDT